MKILAICGSPREGNTESILRRILDGVEFTGAIGKLILLREKKIGFCDGCDGCKENWECHIQDDMREICKEMEEAEVIIIGSPSYWSNVSGLLKNFMDRTNPYYFSKKIKGKKVVLVSVGGISAIKAMEAMNVFATLQGMDVKRSISMKAEGPEEIGKDKKFMNECFELGKEIGSNF
ncbi:MAG: flavodoxin family protein [Candidatus Aenigmarchaeota archaeon]|nr:flavodoxin family protein [Candidatus Aenigmarchaeota archaeon]